MGKKPDLVLSFLLCDSRKSAECLWALDHKNLLDWNRLGAEKGGIDFWRTLGEGIYKHPCGENNHLGNYQPI